MQHLPAASTAVFPFSGLFYLEIIIIALFFKKSQIQQIVQLGTKAEHQNGSKVPPIHLRSSHHHPTGDS